MSDSTQNPYTAPTDVAAAAGAHNDGRGRFLSGLRREWWRYVAMPVLAFATISCSIVALMEIEELMTLPPITYGMSALQWEWTYFKTVTSAILLAFASGFAGLRVWLRHPDSGRLAAMVILAVGLWLGLIA